MDDTCRHCGRGLPEPAGRGRPRIYCDRVCARAWHRARRQDRRIEQETGRACGAPDCEETLAGRRAGVIFCTPACKQRARPSRRVADPQSGGGRPGPRPGRRKYAAGHRFGALVLVEYAEPTTSGSRCRFDCDCGRRGVELALRNVVSGATTQCTDRSRHPDPRLRGEAVTAGTRHQQLVRHHGAASTHPCMACGAVGAGNQWAYLHSTPDEVSQLTGKNRGQVYSHDDDSYACACRTHHAALDASFRRHFRPGQLSGFHVALAQILAPDPDADT